MFFDKNKNIIDKLQPLGYNADMIRQIADKTDNGEQDRAILDFIGKKIPDEQQALQLMNYIKSESRRAFLDRIIYIAGYLVLVAVALFFYIQLSSRVGVIDIFIPVLPLFLIYRLIRNIQKYSRIHIEGPVLSVSETQKKFRVSKDTRLRISKKLSEEGFEDNEMAEDAAETFVQHNEQQTVELLRHKYNMEETTAVKVLGLIKNEFRSFYHENAWGYLAVAVITTLLSWFVWRFTELTWGSLLAYAFIIFLIWKCIESVRKAGRINY